ncbi:hypothetical protein B0T22DRAFT_518925, partial [Podospora appendiculata]
VDAVVVVQLDPDVQLGIFGVAVCSVPSLHSPVKFAHAELGLACTLDLRSGVFKLEAQLSPRSFILHPSCHLTGGMALYAWFGSAANELAGDWVLTIGGFHQAFNKPPQYPCPPRLGISWALGPALRIRGEAYFAITPRVCMGGGRLYAALAIGALSAWFDAFIDFLINYRPFYFSAVGSISVGVRFSMDLWLVTVRISAEIGATLTVAGPPMAGTVHVDFWVFGFDIEFGDKSGMARPDRMELGAFKDLALKSASAGGTGLPLDWVDVDVQEEEDEDEESAAKETTKPFLFNCVQGLVPESEVAHGPGGAASLWRAGKDKDMWVVRGGGLSFTITLGFAASEGEFKDDRESAVVKKKEIPIADVNKAIYAQPMCLTEPITSKVTVTVSQSETDVVMLRNVPEKRKDDQWSVEPIIKSIPRSVWGKYDPEQDPMLKGNNVGGLLSGATSGTESGTIPLVMGLTITPPAPYKSKDRIPKFNLVEDIKLTVNAKGYPFPDPTKTASDMWAPRVPVVDTDPWEDVKSRWADERNRPEDVVRMWAKRLRFGEGSLTGKRPAALLKRFDTMVPALPMVATGTGGCEGCVAVVSCLLEVRNLPL